MLYEHFNYTQSDKNQIYQNLCNLKNTFQLYLTSHLTLFIILNIINPIILNIDFTFSKRQEYLAL